jgi:hypothetical protein
MYGLGSRIRRLMKFAPGDYGRSLAVALLWLAFADYSLYNHWCYLLIEYALSSLDNLIR